MPYEVDFLPVGEGCSGDAIALRYAVPNGYEVMVVDGGTEESGEALVEHIQTFYKTTEVMHAVCTHPDGDHSSGLRKVMESLTVRNLWTHVPWVHAERTRHMFWNDWTNGSLSAAIQVKYPIINELTDRAILNKVPIRYPFQGEKIGPFVVAAPSLQRYERLLPQFRNTPSPDEALLRSLGEWLVGLGKRTTRAILKTIMENRGVETLREGGMTSAENESSVVLYGAFPADNRSVLLTADAGLTALGEAIDYVIGTYGGFANLGLLQVPHHGSRNNISPSTLNRVIGRPLPEGQKRNVSAFVSASLEDEDHPRQVVVNAFDRRGVIVYPTHGKKLMDRCNMPPRPGWVPAVTIPFATRVEEYD